MPADPQDLNGYAYGKGNPVLRADPTGLYVPNDPTSTEDPVQQFREDNPTRSAGGSGTITLPGGNHFAGGGSSGKTSPGRALQSPPDCTWGMLPVFACARTTGNPRHTAQSTGNGFNWNMGGPCVSPLAEFIIAGCGTSLATTGAGEGSAKGGNGPSSSDGDVSGLAKLITALGDAARNVIKNIPRGFVNAMEFERFAAMLKSGFAEAGYGDTEAAFQGSSVTGVKYTTGAPFDKGRVSDYDVAGKAC